MGSVYIDIRVVPAADIAQFVHKVSGGSMGRFVEQLVEFGLPLAKAMASGSKIASGIPYVGFHEVRAITLRDAIDPMTTILFKEDADRRGIELADLPDIPTLSRIGQIGKMMCEKNSARVIERLAYWFYVAAQIYWMEYRLYIMDHAKGSYENFCFPPLWEKRFELDF